MQKKNSKSIPRFRGLRASLIAPLSFLLIVGSQQFLVKEVTIPGTFYSTIYAYEDFLVQQCKTRAQYAHADRIASIEERSRMLGKGPFYTTIVFGGLSVVAGVLTGGALAFPVIAIGAAEVAWMHNDIAEQKSEATRRASQELANEELKCVEDAILLEQELSVLDAAESTFRFNFTSGALLGGLVDIPNGVKTKTSVTHIGFNFS